MPITSKTKLVDIWNELPGSFGVYTWSTKERIPDCPGIYAWFLPLSLRGNDDTALDDLFASAREVHSPETSAALAPRLGWDTLEIQCKKVLPSSELKGRLRTEYARISAENGDELLLLRRYLLLASVLTPALYVGKADSLVTRYYDHVHGRGSRLAERLAENGSARVQELLFLAIAMDSVESGTHFQELIEHILNRLTRPVYGRR